MIGITGDAGMGKSRLVAEIIRLAGAAGMTGLGGECQSYGTSIAYLVWRPIFRALFGLTSTMSAAEQVGALERQLAAFNPTLVPQVPLLGGVLDLAIPDNEMTGPIPPPVRKQLLEGLLVTCLRARAASEPMLLMLEDCHWIDSVSYDLLDLVGKSLADLPVLLVAAYRPPEDEQGRVPAITRLPHGVEIALADFTEADSAHLIDLKLAQLFGAAGEPPEALVALVTARAQGNPFYIEELLNYLKDLDIDPFDHAALARLDLPNSLQSLLLARIDRLTENQQLTMKVASIIGRRFAEPWLWGVHPGLGERSVVRESLQTLSRLDLTSLEAAEPELTYLYKHMVTWEVAYESLTRATRQRLHEQPAQFLERAFESAGLPVDLLAYHYGRSANRPKEALYCGLAGKLAVKNGAYADAHAYLTRALQIVQGLPESSQRAEQEIGLQLGPGGVLLLTRGQGAPEAKAAYDRARELCVALGESPQLARVLFGLWTYYLFHGDMGVAQELAEESLRLAEAQGDQEAQLQAHFALSHTVYRQGKFDLTVWHVDKVSELYDPDQYLNYIARYAQNPRITAMTEGAWAVWILGYPERALRIAEEALAIARELKHEFSIVIAHLDGYLLFQGKGLTAKETTSGGFDYGVVTLQTDDKSATCTIFNQNENLIALSSASSRPLAMAPDLICYLTTDGQPLSNADLDGLKADQEVAIIGASAWPELRNPSIVAAFMQLIQSVGYYGPYAPIKTLHQRTRSVAK